MKAVLIGVVALLLVACGTTVRGHSTAEGPTGDNGLSAADNGGSGTGPGTGPGAGAGAGVGSGIGSGLGSSSAAGGSTLSTSAGPTSLAAPGGATSAAPTGAGPPTSSASAADLSPVEVGFIVEASDAALASSLALSGVDNGDEPAYAAAMVAYVNAHGGLAGHRVTPVYYSLNPESTADYSTLEQQACTALTEDNHAIAGLTAFHNTADQDFTACMEQHGAATIDPTGYAAGAAANYADYSDYFTPDGLEVERQAVAYVDGLDGEGFFAPGVKVGLLAEDVPTYHSAITTALEPTLAHYGVHLADVEYYPETSSTSDLGSTVATISAAELRFAADGIKRVMFLEDGALGAYELMLAADSQGYYPRYGLSTTDAPDGLIGLGAPKSELAGTVGIGWIPLSDVGSGEEGHALPPGQDACLSVMHAAGAAMADDTAEQVAMEYCEQLLFLQRAVDETGSPTLLGIRNGVDALGTTFASPETFETRFDTAHHDGVAAYRPIAFVGTCSCFQYTGTLEPIP